MSDAGNHDASVEVFGQGPAPSAVGPSPENVAAIRAHGWMENEKLNYDAFNAPTSETTPAWAGAAAVYEWTGEEGDIGPPDAELEGQLFGGEHNRAGTSLDHILNFKAIIDGPKQYKPIDSVGSFLISQTSDTSCSLLRSSTPPVCTPKSSRT